MASLRRRNWPFSRRLGASLPVGAGVSLTLLGWLPLAGATGRIPWYVFLSSIALTGAVAGLVSMLAAEALLRKSRTA
jgi:hypothetical protein